MPRPSGPWNKEDAVPRRLRNLCGSGPKAFLYRWRGLTPRWPRSLRLSSASRSNIGPSAASTSALYGKSRILQQKSRGQGLAAAAKRRQPAAESRGLSSADALRAVTAPSSFSAGHALPNAPRPRGCDSLVAVHAAVCGLRRGTARGRACNERVEAPAFVVDLHNVAGLDPLEPHRKALHQDQGARAA